MSKKVWLITGAGRGMGVDFARAALASGHSVVASGRDHERVSRVLGTSSDLLAVTLDVTSPTDAEAAVRAAIDRFGRIDVLVNNAASFYAGYFEELTPEQIDQQLAASLIGPRLTSKLLCGRRGTEPGHDERQREDKYDGRDADESQGCFSPGAFGEITRRRFARSRAPMPTIRATSDTQSALAVARR
jgi:NAD(P)-dependent dehydrogenase (short-subunit alcohol dehydrogenase family)